jgi:hypothetical protein
VEAQYDSVEPNARVDRTLRKLLASPIDLFQPNETNHLTPRYVKLTQVARINRPSCEQLPACGDARSHPSLQLRWSQTDLRRSVSQGSSVVGSRSTLLRYGLSSKYASKLSSDFAGEERPRSCAFARKRSGEAETFQLNPSLQSSDIDRYGFAQTASVDQTWRTAHVPEQTPRH